MIKMEFDSRVFSALKKIPFGKVATYKQIAVAIGNPNSSRAVGNALNRNKDLVNIPCYKVVKSNGRVGGYAKGIKRKIELLRKDGIEIKNGKIDLKKYGCSLLS